MLQLLPSDFFLAVFNSDYKGVRLDKPITSSFPFSKLITCGAVLKFNLNYKGISVLDFIMKFVKRHLLTRLSGHDSDDCKREACY